MTGKNENALFTFDQNEQHKLVICRILHPAGYDAYFCRGSCASAATITSDASNYHLFVRVRFVHRFFLCILFAFLYIRFSVRSLLRLFYAIRIFFFMNTLLAITWTLFTFHMHYLTLKNKQLICFSFVSRLPFLFMVDARCIREKCENILPSNTQNMLRNQSTHNKEKSLELVPCCTATQFSPLQLFYMENNSTATRKTLPNMVVEACGCM